MMTLYKPNPMNARILPRSRDSSAILADSKNLQSQKTNNPKTKNKEAGNVVFADFLRDHRSKNQSPFTAGCIASPAVYHCDTAYIHKKREDRHQKPKVKRNGPLPTSVTPSNGRGYASPALPPHSRSAGCQKKM
jgi:hypothetical protein